VNFLILIFENFANLTGGSLNTTMILLKSKEVVRFGGGENRVGRTSNTPLVLKSCRWEDSQ